MKINILFLFAVVVCVGIFSRSNLFAANGTWLNTGSASADWSETTNWVDGSVPGSTSSTDASVATFDTAVGTYGTLANPILIDSEDLNLRSLFFDGTAGSYTIGTTNGNAIYLNGTWNTNIEMKSSLSSSDTTVTINAPLVITARNGSYGVIQNMSGATNSLVIAGGITGGSEPTLIRLSGKDSNINTISGVIADGTGAVSIEKLGTTTWKLLGANTYSGTTKISGGSLEINSSASLGDGSVTNTIEFTSGNLVSIEGTYSLGSNRSILISGTTANIQALSGHLTVNGDIAATGTSTLTVGSSGFNGDVTLSGKISGNSLSVAKSAGTGTLFLTGSNSYGGATSIGNGAVKITAANNLGNGAAGNDLFVSGGRLITHGTFDLGANRNIRTGGYTRIENESGTLTVSGSVSGTGNTFELMGDGNFIVSGSIGHSGAFTKSGTGEVRLTNANTYTGKTTVSAGILRLDHATALPGGIGVSGGTSNLAVSNDAVIGLGIGDFSRTLGTGNAQFTLSSGGFAAYGANRTVNIGGDAGSLTWNTSGFLNVDSRTLTLGATDADGTLIWKNAINLGSSGANVRTIQVDNGSATVDAVIDGALTQTGGTQSLIKAGDGTLTLSVANTYAGTTTVSAGTLLVNGSIGSTAAVTVQSGATIGGSGSIAGNLIVQSGGTLSPGNSPGLLSVGGLTLNSGSSTHFEINGTNRGVTFDAVDISSGGSVQFGGIFNLDFAGIIGAESTLNLFGFDTTSIGDFSSVSSTGYYAGSWSKEGDDWSLFSKGQTLIFSEANGNLYVSAIPEPATWMLFSLALTVVLLAYRRRRA